VVGQTKMADIITVRQVNITIIMVVEVDYFGLCELVE
jgi:hypothetical protein